MILPVQGDTSAASDVDVMSGMDYVDDLALKGLKGITKINWL